MVYRAKDAAAVRPPQRARTGRYVNRKKKERGEFNAHEYTWVRQGRRWKGIHKETGEAMYFVLVVRNRRDFWLQVSKREFSRFGILY